MINFNQLDSKNWVGPAKLIYDALKIELQSGGLIKEVKNNLEPNLFGKIDALMSTIKVHNNFFELDEQINTFTNKLLSLNTEISSLIYYNYLNLLENMVNSDLYPLTNSALNFIKNNKNETTKTFRLHAIIAKVVNESLSQANKSNAGLAMQTVVKATLKASGLKNGIHYKEKYKSSQSVEANFVFPAISDYSDENVDAILACQMSSNDRLKLASEELKIGKLKFIFTGNGLDASTKKLKHISDTIIKNLYNKKIKLICYNKEIKYEFIRLKKFQTKEYDLRLSSIIRII